MTEQARFEEWAIVEVMGHQRYAGLVSEQAIGGTSFVRVDVPALEDVPAFTKLLGSSSIFSITPVTREIAVDAAWRFASRPITIVGTHLRLVHDEEPEYGV